MGNVRDPWSELLANAVIWFLPALVFLPLYLIVIAVSAFGGDGALLEPFEKKTRRIRAALGPLLVLCGGVATVSVLVWANDSDVYLYGGSVALVCFIFGIAMIRQELARLRARR